MSKKEGALSKILFFEQHLKFQKIVLYINSIFEFNSDQFDNRKQLTRKGHYKVHKVLNLKVSDLEPRNVFLRKIVKKFRWNNNMLLFTGPSEALQH